MQGAIVLVENVEMNTSTKRQANQTGYYEATLLLAGTYRISTEVAGFKKIVRTGLILPMSGTLDVDLAVEVGKVTETESVTADAPVLLLSYQGNKDQVVDLPARINTALPTMLERKGDFFRYLQIDPVRYQIHDPLSVQADPARGPLHPPAFRGQHHSAGTHYQPNLLRIPEGLPGDEQ